MSNDKTQVFEALEHNLLCRYSTSINVLLVIWHP